VVGVRRTCWQEEAGEEEVVVRAWLIRGFGFVELRGVCKSQLVKYVGCGYR
jgi:hypothetical protein